MPLKRVKGNGDCLIEYRVTDNEVRNIKLCDVLYVPGLDRSLLSVKRLDENDRFVPFGTIRLQLDCAIEKNDNVIIED